MKTKVNPSDKEYGQKLKVRKDNRTELAKTTNLDKRAELLGWRKDLMSRQILDKNYLNFF